MTGYNLRIKNKMNSIYIMIYRIYLSIHYRRFNWHLLIQFINRYCSPRYILRSGSLPLRSQYRSSIRNFCSNIPLISPIYRRYTTPTMKKSSIYSYIYRSKSNIFPSTLPRIERNTPTICRLPRHIYYMKHSIIRWSNHLVL